MTDAVEERSSHLAGEIRTFLIADVRGYTRYTVQHGDEAAAHLASCFAALTREVVEGFQGQLIELRGDEALVVFASARQALRASMRLQERYALETAASGLPLRVGIGLDAGEAVPVDGGYRGGALNLAARLCSLAGPREVLASDGVIHLARATDSLRYLDRGTVQLKGLDNPVRVVEVQAASGDSGAEDRVAEDVSGTSRPDLPLGGYLGALPTNRLVGREAETECCRSAIARVVEGAGQLLLLTGEPGAGKTRLAQEVTLDLRNRDFVLAAGRCYEPQQTVSFYPFVEALTSLYMTASVEVHREVTGRWSDMARLLPSIGISTADSSGAGPQDQQRLFWAVTGFVRALAAKSPVAILLDDLHWADAASLELLQHLARHSRGDPVFLLGTYRDVEVGRHHPLEGALRDLQREGLVERVAVRRLNPEQTRMLIGTLVGEEEVTGEFADLLYARAEGNPFFVQQVLHVLMERGDLYRKDGRWDRKRLQDIEVPESIRSVVGQRLARLPAGTHDVLREASVLGQSFQFDDLRAMSGRDESDLERALDEAAETGMIRESGRDSYSFDHALTQGALYADLSSRRRRRMHLAAGESIESLPERKRRARAAELAWHFLEADDPERALRWSMAAGDEAERMFAHSDAEHHYRTALHLAEEEGRAEEALEARERLADALALSGQHDDAVELYEQAAGEWRDRGDFASELRVTAAIGQIMFEQGRRDVGMARLHPVLERWERDPLTCPGAVSLHVAMAELHWHAGHLEESLRIANRSVELAIALDDSRLLGVAEARRGMMLSHIGRAEEAMVAFTRAIPLLESSGELLVLQKTLHNRGMQQMGARRADEGLADLDRSLEVARRLGEPVALGWALHFSAYVRWNRGGRWQEIEPFVDEFMQLARSLRGTRVGLLVPMLIWTRFQGGNDLSALDELYSLAEDAERDGDITLWQGAQSQLALWDVLHGRAGDAVDRYERVLARGGLEDQYVVIMKGDLAHACAIAGDLERAESLLEEIMRAWSQDIHVFGWPHWLTYRATLRAAQGRRKDARSDFDEALTLLRGSHRIVECASVLVEYGEALAHFGETGEAREKLEEALRFFREMNARFYIERVEGMLAGLAPA